MPANAGHLCTREPRQRTLLWGRLAEREGFEPPIRLPVCRISSAVHSTTLPPLHQGQDGAKPRGAGKVIIERRGRNKRRGRLFAAVPKAWQSDRPIAHCRTPEHPMLT